MKDLFHYVKTWPLDPSDAGPYAAIDIEVPSAWPGHVTGRYDACRSRPQDEADTSHHRPRLRGISRYSPGELGQFLGEKSMLAGKRSTQPQVRFHVDVFRPRHAQYTQRD